jgi:hypothetical protein
MKHKWVEYHGLYSTQRPVANVEQTGPANWHWYVFDHENTRYAYGDRATLAEAQADAIAALKRLEGEA